MKTLRHLSQHRNVIGYDMTQPIPVREGDCFRIKNKNGNICEGGLKPVPSLGQHIMFVENGVLAYAIMELNSDYSLRKRLKNRILGKALEKLVKEVNALPSYVKMTKLLKQGWEIE